MTLSEWLSQEVGRASEMATTFGITPSAVSQWRDNGVPISRMAEVRDLTAGAVTIEEMVMDRVTRAAA